MIVPKVFLVGETRIVEEQLQAFLAHVGVPAWTSDAPSDTEKLIEVMGRLCYKSFAPGLNPNVSRIRESNADYIGNILNVKHGSVIEHPEINFIFADVSRVFTHELVRHRVGVGISQESMRFVRVQKLEGWVPTVIHESEEAFELWSTEGEVINAAYQRLEQGFARIYKLNESKTPFHLKKVVTSALRRKATHEIPTNIGWSANPRTLRWVIEMRTEPGAEEEIRLVFGQVAEICLERYPNLFGDFSKEMADGHYHYKPRNSKI